MGGAAGIEVGEGPARAPAPRRPPPAPRPRHVERTSHACTVTQEVKETGTHGPTSHRNKDGGPCGSEGDQLGRERAGGRGEGQGVREWDGWGVGACGGGVGVFAGLGSRGQPWLGVRCGGRAGVCARPGGLRGCRDRAPGPRRQGDQVIGFYFKLHFVLAEVGRWERRGPQDDYISVHT